MSLLAQLLLKLSNKNSHVIFRLSASKNSLNYIMSVYCICPSVGCPHIGDCMYHVYLPQSDAPTTESVCIMSV